MYYRTSSSALIPSECWQYTILNKQENTEILNGCGRVEIRLKVRKFRNSLWMLHQAVSEHHVDKVPLLRNDPDLFDPDLCTEGIPVIRLIPCSRCRYSSAK